MPNVDSRYWYTSTASSSDYGNSNLWQPISPPKIKSTPKEEERKMSSAFVPGLTMENAREMHIEDLCAPFEYKGEHGIVINEPRSYNLILRAYGYKIIDEQRTDLEGVWKIQVEKKPESTTPEIYVNDWDGDSDLKQFFKIRAQNCLLPVLNKDIIFTAPHGTVSRPILNPKTFVIHIWSSPTGEKTIVPPAMAWLETPVFCRNEMAFAPSGQGIPIMDYTNYAWGELIGETDLYIHHDIIHRGQNSETRLFLRIIEEAVEIISNQRYGTIVSKEEIFVSRVVDILKRNAEGLQKELQGWELRCQEASKQLAEAMRKVKAMRSTYKFATTEAEMHKDRLLSEIQKISDNPHVRDLRVYKDKMLVKTDMINCRDPRSGKLHEIGEFVISFNLDCGSTSSLINWQNLTRKVNAIRSDMCHPHIHSDGTACLGSFNEVLPDLFANMELSTIVGLAIEFIENIDVDDTGGALITRWPLAPVQETNSESESMESTKSSEEDIEESAELFCEHDFQNA